MGWLSDYMNPADELAAKGRNGDTMLAHINPQEAALLKSLGGSGTINPQTGLPEFWFGSDLGGSLYDAGSDLVSTGKDIVSGGIGAVRDITGGVASGIEGLTGLNLKDPATVAALGLAAYGFYDPESLGLGATGSSEASGWDAATSGPYGGPEVNTALSNSSMGQASNLASSGTGLQSTGSLGLQGQAAGSSGMLGGSVGYGTGGEGLTLGTGTGAGASVNPAWGEAVAPAANAPWELSDLGSSLKNGVSSLGSTMMENKLTTAMIGSSLYDMYAKKKMAGELEKQRQQQQAKLDAFYAPGSAEYNQLVEGAKRSATAAGRPIDSSQFSADIAARIADKKMQAQTQMSTGQNALLGSQLSNQYGGLNTMFNNMALYTMLAKKGMV